MSVKQCSKGKSCSATCISKGKTCKVTLSDKASEALSKNRELLQRMSGAFDRSGLTEDTESSKSYKDWKVLASGFHGEVSLSPDGERVVKTLRVDRGGVFGPHEVELATKMGQLGHSPKVFSHSDSHIEMELAKGAPLWKSYVKTEEEPVMNTSQAKKAGYAFRDLHKMGFAHGDAHSLQFLVDGDNVKMVDFGLSVPVTKNPVKVMHDLAKIEKLVGWDNPDLKNDPYFATVNKYLKPYRELGDSRSKSSMKKRQELSQAYLQELSQLP